MNECIFPAHFQVLLLHASRNSKNFTLFYTTFTILYFIVAFSYTDSVERSVSVNKEYVCACKCVFNDNYVCC